VIVIARWHLVAVKLHVAPGILIVALAVLVPAVFINLVVLLRRPVGGPASFASDQQQMGS